MIYYFTIYDILHHESIAQEALEYAFASFGACLCKHWSMMVEALPDWTASTGRPPSSRTAATSQRAGSTATRQPTSTARCRHSALGTFQNNSKSRKQLILRHLRDFLFYNNPLYAPHLLHKSILTFFLAVFLTVIRKLTVIAFMKYLNIPSLRKTRLVSIHGNSNLNICAPND